MNVTDVQLAIYGALAQSLHPSIDADASGAPDACELVPIGICGPKTVLVGDTCVAESCACVSGQIESQPCGNCGTAERACGEDCEWSEWGMCIEQGVCEPVQSEPCPSACGTRWCSDECAWGVCSYTKDPYEPNDNALQAEYLGSFDEGEAIPPVTGAWLHGASPIDVDRFYAYCSEGGPFDFSMQIAASLSGGAGWHELCLFWDDGCNGSIDVTKCVSGYGSLAVSTGEVDTTADNSGCFDVEVRGDGSCAKYAITLECD
jgi:hypothetical protein